MQPSAFKPVVWEFATSGKGGTLDTSIETRDPLPVGETIHRLQTGTVNLIKDEIHLIRLEAVENLKSAKSDLVLTLAFGGLLALSVLPLLAAAVIGLGVAMDGRYGLSSLIVGAVCLVVGGGLCAYFAKRLTQKDFSFPHSRAALQGGIDGGFNTLH